MESSSPGQSVRLGAVMAGDHPHYPKSTIVEAVCEFVFERPLHTPWDSAWFGDIFRALGDEYPSIEPDPTPALSLQFILGPPGAAVMQAPPGPSGQNVPQAMRYLHRVEPVSVHVSSLGRINLNVRPAYPGWPRMREHVRTMWDKFAKVVEVESVSRIGLRYINRIERTSDTDTLGTWLRETENVPAAVLTGMPGSVSVLQNVMPEGNRLNVISATEPNAPGSFIFDIDRAVERKLGVSTDTLLAEADRLHDDVWDVFSNAKSRRLELLLKADLR